MDVHCIVCQCECVVTDGSALDFSRTFLLFFLV